MAMEFCKPTIKEIYSDKEKIAIFKAFGALWENRESVIDIIIKERLRECGFKEYPNTKAMYRSVNVDNISLGYDTQGLSFGFIRMPEGKRISKAEQANLETILNDKKLKNIFKKDGPHSNSDWVYKEIDIDMIGVGYIEAIIDNFNILEKLLTKTETQK